MIDWILDPWPWWFAGILIGLTVPLLFISTGHAFGISTSSITGISNFNGPSLVATMFFFVGGLTVTWGLGGWLFD